MSSVPVLKKSLGNLPTARRKAMIAAKGKGKENTFSNANVNTNLVAVADSVLSQCQLQHAAAQANAAGAQPQENDRSLEDWVQATGMSGLQQSKVIDALQEHEVEDIIGAGMLTQTDIKEELGLKLGTRSAFIRAINGLRRNQPDLYGPEI